RSGIERDRLSGTSACPDDPRTDTAGISPPSDPDDADIHALILRLRSTVRPLPLVEPAGQTCRAHRTKYFVSAGLSVLFHVPHPSPARRPTISSSPSAHTCS